VATLTLLAAGILGLATGLAFAYVAHAVTRRPASPENRPAQLGHATWWLGLGAYLVLQGGLTVLAAFDALSGDAYVASRLLAIPLLCACVWGITFYLTFLYTGRNQAGVWLGIAYALVAAVFFYATFGQGPLTMRKAQWVIEIDDSSPLYRIVYVLVGAPPILASLAYLSLLRRVRDPAQRRRILLVAGSILAYVGSGLAARLAASDLVIFVTLVLFGGGAALMSLAAYRTHPHGEAAA
jgi:hypothetical protein